MRAFVRADLALASLGRNCQGPLIGSMGYDTTIGWSLFTSGVVTLLLLVAPYDSLYWGIGLLVLGLLVMSRRVF